MLNVGQWRIHDKDTSGNRFFIQKITPDYSTGGGNSDNKILELAEIRMDSEISYYERWQDNSAGIVI